MDQIAVFVIGSQGHDQRLIAKKMVAKVIVCYVQLHC